VYDGRSLTMLTLTALGQDDQVRGLEELVGEVR